MMAHFCNPRYLRGGGRRASVQGQPEPKKKKKVTPYHKEQARDGGPILKLFWRQR
jgi:hypothetical protein